MTIIKSYTLVTKKEFIMKKILLASLIATSLFSSPLDDFNWLDSYIKSQSSNYTLPVVGESISLNKIYAEQIKDEVDYSMDISYDLSQYLNGRHLSSEKESIALTNSVIKKFKTFLLDSSCTEHNLVMFEHNVVLKKHITWTNIGSNKMTNPHFDIDISSEDCIKEGYLAKKEVNGEVFFMIAGL